jgi:tRNA dimethylallyltransferase
MGVIVVGGATASGKSELAVRLAEKYDGEIISADALLVYRRLNIGTAKPTEEEKRGIPHYMIDVAEPTESFSVSDYERLATPILQDILSRGKTAIICGGTGFYIKSLLFKSRFGNTPANEEVRKKYEAIAQERGRGYMRETGYSRFRDLRHDGQEEIGTMRRGDRPFSVYGVCDRLPARGTV